MEPQIHRLIQAAKALVDYIESEQVYDKLADCGCGGVDSYRSDRFDAVILEAKKALEDLGAMGAARPAAPGPAGPPGGSSCPL